MTNTTTTYHPVAVPHLYVERGVGSPGDPALSILTTGDRSVDASVVYSCVDPDCPNDGETFVGLVHVAAPFYWGDAGFIAEAISPDVPSHLFHAETDTLRAPTTSQVEWLRDNGILDSVTVATGDIG